jgi:hypothetical protein
MRNKNEKWDEKLIYPRILKRKVKTQVIERTPLEKTFKHNIAAFLS